VDPFSIGLPFVIAATQKSAPQQYAIEYRRADISALELSPPAICSMNPPSRAVALNCGMGSSSWNADVNAFDRLHMVRGPNSLNRGLK